MKEKLIETVEQERLYKLKETIIPERRLYGSSTYGCELISAYILTTT
jgi:hypothetical protein